MKVTNEFQEIVLTGTKATIQNTGNCIVELLISPSIPDVSLKGEGIKLYKKGDQQAFVDIGTGNKLYVRATDDSVGYINFLNFI